MTGWWWAALAVAFLPTVLVLLGIRYQEKVARVLVRWRYAILSPADKDGWMARADFERKDP